MEQNPINLAANLKTKVCDEALNILDDESMIDFRQEHIYDLVNASKDDVFVFTSNGAEAINQVLWSVFLQISRKTGKCHFITSQIEDAPTLQMMKRLEELGCFVKIVPVLPNGEIDIEKLKSLITSRTALISISMSQGLTGVIQPVEEVAKIAKEHKVLLHLEATHSVGRYYFDFNDLDCDYLTFSGDRIHAPIATGGLFAKKEAPLEPLILGGASLRGGNFDSKLFLSLMKAASLASLHQDVFSIEAARLKNIFEKELCKKIPNTKILFRNSLTLPNTTVLAFPHIHQEALVQLLSRKNLSALIGGNYHQHLYSLLIQSGIDPSLSSCAVSFSFDRFFKQKDLEQAVAIIEDCVKNLSAISPDFDLPADPQTYSVNKQPPKIREKIQNPKFAGKFTHLQAQEKGMRLVQSQEKGLVLYWLVDESDGIIADAKYQAFGPSSLIAIGEIISELAIRKNYQQISRMTADLIDQHVREKSNIAAFSKEAHPLLNQALSAIDQACQKCSDINCSSNDFDTTPILWDSLENPNGIEGWEEFSKEKKIFLIEEVIDKEIRPYVELDAGGVKIVDLTENNELTISYQGSCTTCHSATGSTLTAIQQILRQRIHPKITVIPLL